MNEKSQQLLEKARVLCTQFSQDEILKKYWGQISLILKGSTARGNADKYSDLDFVFYCSDKIKQQIIQEYYNAKRISRTDGIFVHLRKIGHYSFENFEDLTTSYSTRNYLHIWETQNIIVLSDPTDQYTTQIKSLSEPIFTNHEEIIKETYLQIQLALDWLRHPLKRGDEGAVVLYCAKLTQQYCQIAFLLDKKPFPPDKWIFFYLEETTFGMQIKDELLHYIHSFNSGKKIKGGRDCIFYPHYRNAARIMKRLKNRIRSQFGDKLWIQQWFNFV